MAIPLLSTKLFIPPTRSNAIARPRLTEKLMASLSQPGRFVLLSGPVGFGKTTLLSDFVSRLKRPAAWVSLDEGDNDAVRFWTYVIRACRSILEEVGEPALEILSTPQPILEDTGPSILINDLTTQEGLVLISRTLTRVCHTEVMPFQEAQQGLICHLMKNNSS